MRNYTWLPIRGAALIGELLCRSGRKNSKELFDDDDLTLCAPHEQGLPEDQTLRELSKRLKSKNIRVERFVRIACPARGTTLVSGRLDRWLEIIVNVLDKVLEPTAKIILGVLTDLLLELKKQAANPLAIPGLAVMMPESGFIRMINRPDVQVDVDFCVIAGDIEKSDILGRLAIFFTDRFYDEDHDLVVQSRAMYGGTAHEDGFYYFHKGTDVNHFHYFSNRKTAEKILEALTLKSQELKSKGFRPLSEAYQGQAIAEIDLIARSYQKRSNISQPVVYIVPGIMGTHLAEGGNRIWLDLLELARGGIANLRISNRDITPHSLVALAYANLIDYLSATHEVIPFPYDWRVSILDEAKRFGQVIKKKLGETKQPIRIVAHSMGGLVTRSMISSHHGCVGGDLPAQGVTVLDAGHAKQGRAQNCPPHFGTGKNTSYACPGGCKKFASAIFRDHFSLPWRSATTTDRAGTLGLFGCKHMG